MARLRQATRDAVRAGAISSAAAVWELIGPEWGCILDVGAGEGHWLDAAQPYAATGADFLGLDLEPSVDRDVEAWDAEAGTPLPLAPNRQPGDKWHIALCLETAEHVTPRAGAHLVRELCRVANRIVWSAAIPGQGGDGHVNEQWPRYWHALFAECGYDLTDPYREALWENPAVEPWYRQNILLAVPSLGQPPRPRPLDLVHPVIWAHHRGVSA